MEKKKRPEKGAFNKFIGSSDQNCQFAITITGTISFWVTAFKRPICRPSRVWVWLSVREVLLEVAVVLHLVDKESVSAES